MQGLVIPFKCHFNFNTIHTYFPDHGKTYLIPDVYCTNKPAQLQITCTTELTSHHLRIVETVGCTIR